VIDASTNSTDATISCVPSGPRHGKCGERIHKKSGIMMIRLIVIELGKFILNPLA